MKRNKAITDDDDDNTATAAALQFVLHVIEGRIDFAYAV
jgi:hypothetical protein